MSVLASQPRTVIEIIITARRRVLKIALFLTNILRNEHVITQIMTYVEHLIVYDHLNFAYFRLPHRLIDVSFCLTGVENTAWDVCPLILNVIFSPVCVCARVRGLIQVAYLDQRQSAVENSK